jgi:acyl-CoA reductase-like NAD-dependent aldehyde dehydrogenase
MLQLECSELILNHAWIDNQRIGSSDGRTFTVEDPADGTVLATLPDCGAVYGIDEYLQMKYLCLGGLGPA